MTDMTMESIGKLESECTTLQKENHKLCQSSRAWRHKTASWITSVLPQDYHALFLLMYQLPDPTIPAIFNGVEEATSCCRQWTPVITISCPCMHYFMPMHGTVSHYFEHWLFSIKCKGIAAIWDQASLSPAIQLQCAHTTVPQFPTMHALAGETDSLCMWVLNLSHYQQFVSNRWND